MYRLPVHLRLRQGRDMSSLIFLSFHNFFLKRQKGTFSTQERIPDFISLQNIKILPFLLFTTRVFFGWYMVERIIKCTI